MSKKEIHEITKEVHKSIIRKFPRRKVIVNGIDDVWSLDLVEMQQFANENNGYKYMLTCIDCFSRYAWAEPIITKTAENVLKALQKIISQSKRMPEKLWCDKGAEFVNAKMKAWMNKNDCTMYHTFSESKSVMIERWNRI